MTFVSQLARDICRKIQKLNGFLGKNRSELLDSHHGSPTGHSHFYLEEKATVKDQCVYCKGMEHWKNESPQWKQVEYPDEHQDKRLPQKEVGSPRPRVVLTTTED